MRRDETQRNNWYRLGYCPQCQGQIMVKNTQGKLTSYKKNYRMANLVFSNDHMLKTIICEGCLKNPDFQELMNSILHEKSEGFKNSSAKIAEMSRAYIDRVVEECGAPISIQDATPSFVKQFLSAQLSKDKFQTMENPNEIFGGARGN